MEIWRVRLPEQFYLPRRTRDGWEIRDIVPWDEAVDYVTDGERYGILFQDRRIWWFTPDRTEQFRRDFEGVDLDALIEGLQEYTRHGRELREAWSEDLAALERLRREPDDEDSFAYAWRWKQLLPERFGQSCRIIKADLGIASVEVEFEDGFRVTAPRTAIRRVRGRADPAE